MCQEVVQRDRRNSSNQFSITATLGFCQICLSVASFAIWTMRKRCPSRATSNSRRPIDSGISKRSIGSPTSGGVEFLMATDFRVRPSRLK